MTLISSSPASSPILEQGDPAGLHDIADALVEALEGHQDAVAAAVDAVEGRRASQAATEALQAPPEAP